MSSSESAGKIRLLSNNNYPEWAGEMKAWLMKNGLWRIVSGKELAPEGKGMEEKYDKWELKVYKAAGEIFLLVESDQRVHFRGQEEDPVKMWSLLEEAHMSKKPGSRFNAYDDLFSIRKAEDESLSSLGVRIEKAMQGIKNLRPSSYTIDTLDEELQCMALIRALPEEYKYLSTSLLLLEKLDKTIILQAFRGEEQNRHRQSEAVNSAKVQKDKGRKSRGQKDRSEGSKPQVERTGESYCDFCEKSGHWTSKCYGLNALKWVAKGGKESEGAKQSEVEGSESQIEVASQASDLIEYNAFTTSQNSLLWNTDTGATSSMTPHKNWLRNYKPFKVPIRLADNSTIYSEGIGSVLFRPLINGVESGDIEFSKVLYVPGLRNNLLAVLYLTKYKGIDVFISQSTMEFRDSNKTTRFTATINSNGVGYLDGFTIDNSEQAQLTSTLPLDLSLWHKRLGHHNYDDIKSMIKKKLVVGLKLDSEDKPDLICEPCLAGKMHANPFPSSDTRATELLELIHSDTHDVGVLSGSGYRYWVSFIDDYSRFKTLIPMKLKSDTITAFKQFKVYAEKLTGKTIKNFRDDKGTEYTSNEFNNLLSSYGIARQHTCRNRPQQNGIAERANRLFSERIVSLLNESGLPEKFWVECLASLVHVTNLCPTSALIGKTPHEVWYGKKPDVSHLRVWGCLAYVHIQKDKREKLGSHMAKCIFIGYPEGYKGWRFYNPETHRVLCGTTGV